MRYINFVDRWILRLWNGEKVGRVDSKASFPKTDYLFFASPNSGILKFCLDTMPYAKDMHYV